MRLDKHGSEQAALVAEEWTSAVLCAVVSVVFLDFPSS